MSEFRTVRKKPEIFVDRLDGGLNKKDGPSRIDLTESPDCLNVEFGDRGSVETREGTSYYNSSPIAASLGQGLTVYDNTMVAWVDGGMYRFVGTAPTEVTAASGLLDEDVKIAYEQYQNILFLSDGENGPYRWEGEESFYKMGVDAPSACTGVSDAAGDIAADTYYYKVSFVNTHAVEGDVSSASAGVTLGASATVAVSDIPVGTTIQGVAERKIYRATSVSGTYNLVNTLSDNVTTSFTDTVGVGSEGVAAPTDNSSPKPFSAIRLHKERLWMPDNDNETLLRYTEFDNPFVSKALNFVQLAEGDGSDIRAIGVQQDLVTAFKDNSIYVVTMSDPSDDTTIQVLKSPSNLGIVGPRALTEDENGIVFMAKRNNFIVGVAYISGIGVVQTQDQYLVSRQLSRKIEADILNYPSTLWEDVNMIRYKNRIYAGVPKNSSSSVVDGLLWFDINRIVYDQDTDPGSWSLWDGVVGCNDFTVFNNELYGIAADTSGYVLNFNNGTYTDADGSGINSYWWSKEIGGEGDIESWIKDFRFTVPWYELLGSYNMKVRTRLDGDAGAGTSYDIDLTPPGAVWNAVNWGSFNWNGGTERQETQIAIGTLLGKRVQIGFWNESTAGQGFKVHSFKLRFNLRRQR